MAGYRVPRPDRPDIVRGARHQTLLARLAGFALLWALVGLMGLLADRAIPRQHLPWKRLTLLDPVGAATRVKAARAGADPAACRAILKAGGVDYREVPARTSGFCALNDSLQLTAGLAPLQPDGAPMTCKQALAVVIWERQVVQTAAFAELDQAVVGIDHYGSYSCRRIYGQSEGPVSEHALANALDIAGFRLADGTTISVLDDWNDPGPRGRFLHQVRDGACRVFLTTLSPDYNAQHANHLHLDMGGWPKCA
ncbi:MAG: extensin family protein [Caulobacter sp.]|nr:extensin family protein [Caulobacter sp.]